MKHWLGLDRAISFTVMARFWLGFAGIVTVVLIARFLSPSEQGYYYTFYSMVALQIVFELGFSFVILQLAAHERASLTFLPGGRIEGDQVAHSRLSAAESGSPVLRSGSAHGHGPVASRVLLL